MDENLSKILYYAPRVLSIIFVIFLSLFALDIFSEGYDFFGTVIGLFMHSIPSFILLGVIVLSWKYELWGGILFFMAGILFFIISFNSIFAVTNFVVFSMPLFLIGSLFLLNHFLKNEL